jgi:hypothetical protein
MIDVYTARRPADVDSRRVTVVDGIENLPPGAPAAAIAEAGTQAPITVAPTVSAAYPELTADIDWSAAVDDATAPSAPLPAGWTPVVSAGDQAIVAVRDQPARQVWVGFTSPSWGKSPDFVVFWARVFDWLGADAGAPDTAQTDRAGATAAPGAAGEYAAVAVGVLGPEWFPESPAFDSSPPAVDARRWPGFYRRADGAERAVNSPALPADDHAPAYSRAADFRSALSPETSGKLSLRANEARSLTGALCVAALACVLLAAMTWNRA